MTTSSAQDQQSKEAISLSGRYLTFRLSRERYGVPISAVSEIIRIMHVTPVPNTTPYLKGIINLRGKIVPVLSLRLRFGLEEIPEDKETSIVILEIRDGEQLQPIGVVVDSVEQVIPFSDPQIEKSPRFSETVESAVISGIGKDSDGTVVILLDMERSLSSALRS